MKDHPKFGKCPTNLTELESWLLRDATKSCGGAQSVSEFYLEVVSDMTGSNVWKEYANERGIES